MTRKTEIKKEIAHLEELRKSERIAVPYDHYFTMDGFVDEDTLKATFTAYKPGPNEAEYDRKIKELWAEYDVLDAPARERREAAAERYKAKRYREEIEHYRAAIARREAWLAEYETKLNG